jgi:transcriptional regulator with XRE-family HTH domain
MELPAILERIDKHRTQLGLSDRALSLRASGSGDLIRNWRRAVAEGKASSVNHVSLQSVANALGVTIEALLDSQPLEEEVEIRRLISQLSAPLRRQLLGYAEALVEQQARQPEYDADGG